MISNRTALVLIDMQNEFLHPDGAYSRGGATSAQIAALVQNLKPVVAAFRKASGWIVSTHFTLVPGKDGVPFIDPHLRALRPFLRKGDFAPGHFGHALIDDLAPADLSVEKIAYSAFYQTRLDWVLRKAGVTDLVFGGIVTNGGVSSTVRDAHVLGYKCSVLSDGCAAFDPGIHKISLEALKSVADVTTIADLLSAWDGKLT